MKLLDPYMIDPHEKSGNSGGMTFVPKANTLIPDMVFLKFYDFTTNVVCLNLYPVFLDFRERFF